MDQTIEYMNESDIYLLEISVKNIKRAGRAYIVMYKISEKDIHYTMGGTEEELKELQRALKDLTKNIDL